jgi:hypothetical protein
LWTDGPDGQTDRQSDCYRAPTSSDAGALDILIMILLHNIEVLLRIIPPFT